MLTRFFINKYSKTNLYFTKLLKRTLTVTWKRMYVLNELYLLFILSDVRF